MSTRVRWTRGVAQVAIALGCPECWDGPQAWASHSWDSWAGSVEEGEFSFWLLVLDQGELGKEAGFSRGRRGPPCS